MLAIGRALMGKPKLMMLDEPSMGLAPKLVDQIFEIIGDRPGARTAADALIVEAAVRANTAFGRKTGLARASTDANVPMALGIPAIVIGGGGKTGGFHALSEWIDLTDAWKGAQTSLVTVLGLVGVQGVSAPLLEKRPPRTR